MGLFFINCVLLSHLVFSVGFFGLFNFIGHSLFSDKVANRIGWISNGFQKELGYVSLGIGFCGRPIIAPQKTKFELRKKPHWTLLQGIHKTYYVNPYIDAQSEINYSIDKKIADTTYSTGSSAVMMLV